MSRHRTASDYRYGCRCPEAREAYRLYRKRGREGRGVPQVINSLGTARRLQALAAIGWSCPDLAVELGYGSYAAVSYLQRRDRPTVLRSIAERVAAVYDRLSMTPGASVRAVRTAARNGWAPPLAWDDDEIDLPQAKPRGKVTWDAAPPDPAVIERVVRGERRADEVLRRSERDAAIHQCRALGIPAHEIARRVGVSTRTVDRVVSAPPRPSLVQTISAA
jgi:DNA-binding NarL/FixJ family response regulator